MAMGQSASVGKVADNQIAVGRQPAECIPQLYRQFGRVRFTRGFLQGLHTPPRRGKSSKILEYAGYAVAIVRWNETDRACDQATAVPRKADRRAILRMTRWASNGTRAVLSAYQVETAAHTANTT